MAPRGGGIRNGIKKKINIPEISEEDEDVLPVTTRRPRKRKAEQAVSDQEEDKPKEQEVASQAEGEPVLSEHTNMNGLRIPNLPTWSFDGFSTRGQPSRSAGKVSEFSFLKPPRYVYISDNNMNLD
jgi:hypothetical protein